MFRMNFIDWVAFVLLVLCGLDLGLSGLFNINLIASVFGPISLTSFIIYAVVAIASVYMIYSALKKTQPNK